MHSFIQVFTFLFVPLVSVEARYIDLNGIEFHSVSKSITVR